MHIEEPLFRDHILERLRSDLIGPMKPDELISDRPSQRYSTGILYPKDSPISQEENQDGGSAANFESEPGKNDDEPGVSLHSTLKPSTAGLSFAISPSIPNGTPILLVKISCAKYAQCAIDNDGQKVPGPPKNRAAERWQRIPLNSDITLTVTSGAHNLNLSKHGLDGMELYVLSTPHSSVITITIALINSRKRGDSLAFDEEQHFFQVSFSVNILQNGTFCPRPSGRAKIDDDSRSAALIYRNTKQMVVGHTSSAKTSVDFSSVYIDWIPASTVPRVSDRGDSSFNKLHASEGTLRPLQAQWLATASQTDLIHGLNEVVAAYSNWIKKEQNRIESLDTEFRPQAELHLNACVNAAQRMSDAISEISSNLQIRTSFQLAQEAMATQFKWSRNNSILKWRPFQLAFQLLVLQSLANRTHPDREIMDLLWFPTGGGKTEAYLFLTAFVIFLRRLRSELSDDGTGTCVIMRYTLRLLTIQQFQRAAIMICACEMIRRNSANLLGTSPIGIGLWVGASATPLTLEAALKLPLTDPSTPKQLIKCPCCQNILRWDINRHSSTVSCQSDPAQCEYAKSGSTLPIWTIDEEIYRYSPSLLIGTIDKFSQIVRKPETGAIFDKANTFPPDLIIQDELHLISGPLGSIAGLYEVALDELCRRDSVRPKIIGSTATIRRASEQIRALFDREAFQFPPPGIDADNSGFAVTDHSSPGRLYVGITTAGRSATYMLQAISACLLQSSLEPTATSDVRDHYWTLVTYFNSLRELGRALVLMQDDVPVSVRQFAARRNEQARKISPPAELTSRVPSYEIRDMLDRLAKPYDNPEAVDLLVASNMISVGMDIPRLGLMLVNAQPKTLSEYIQATSRVGRGNVPGLVVTMYNGMRARDRSHYESFESWHQCLYREVEATSVTPFASRAQDKALHAVLVALVRHLVPGMIQRPILRETQRHEVEKIASAIEARVARIDLPELPSVSKKLQSLIDEWISRPDLQVYWDDYGRKRSLLLSAEQYAAKIVGDDDLQEDGIRQALWPTPNSMREVEPGAPFVLRTSLKNSGE